MKVREGYNKKTSLLLTIGVGNLERFGGRKVNRGEELCELVSIAVATGAVDGQQKMTRRLKNRWPKDMALHTAQY